MHKGFFFNLIVTIKSAFLFLKNKNGPTFDSIPTTHL